MICANIDIAFINSKGSGGNNATATVLSPSVSLSENIGKDWDTQQQKIGRKKIEKKLGHPSFVE